MINKALSFIVILSVIFGVSTAYALSCAPAPLDKTILENAEIVFEGVAGEGRAVTRKENQAIKKTGHKVRFWFTKFLPDFSRPSGKVAKARCKLSI